MQESRACLVHTTCADVESARRLADALVEQRLAACVSVGAAVESRFPWEGRIDQETEVPVTIKTLEDRLDDLEAAFATLHPYEVPEILAVPVSRGNKPYLDWMNEWMNP